MSAKTEYLNWRRGPPVGCVFARWLSNHPREFGQRIEELPSTGQPARVAGTIAARIDRYIRDDDIRAVALIMPSVKNLRRLMQIALGLGTHPGWGITTTTIDASVVAVRVARDIPFNQVVYASEVLVLGPFDNFPATRRSPVTAFEIFVGQPLPVDPKDHQPKTKTNLADMDLSGTDLTAAMINQMWISSGTGRRRSLGGIDDARAKAKVSFVIPTSLATQLGCAP
jgi:hypothetical protein